MFSLGRNFARFVDTPPPEPQTDEEVTAELAAVRDSAIVDLTNRLHAAVNVIDELMRAELARGRDGRNVALFNALLEVRTALQPGTSVLPLRPRTPVIPGRTS